MTSLIEQYQYPTLKAEVIGQAESKGSKTVGKRKDGSTFMREDNPRVARWMTQVKKAMKLDKPKWPLDVPVTVRVIIYQKRPKSHWTALRSYPQLIHSAPVYPKSGRDVDKVERAILDAGKALWWSDDQRVADLHITRLYADLEQNEEEKVIISCQPLEPWEERSRKAYELKGHRVGSRAHRKSGRA